MMADEKLLTYINTNDESATSNFCDHFYSCLTQRLQESRFESSREELLILCIGTDRATGDSLGPIVGYKLTEMLPEHLGFGVRIRGTLDFPVHAKNITEVVAELDRQKEKPIIVAIDACLGRIEHIGYLTLGLGSVHPGAGMKKQLPPVGDISVTGIVNFCGLMDQYVLQNTRLSIVMRMADVISSGITEGVLKWKQEQ